MSNSILILLSLAVVVALVLLFRASTLLDVYKNNFKSRVDSYNKLNAAMFIVVLVLGVGGFIWYSYVTMEKMLPESASVHGIETDYWFWFSMIVILIPFVITHVLLFAFSYIYQYKKESKAYFYPHNGKLELIWTVVPAIVLTLLVLSGYKTWTDITSDSPKDAEVIEVMGKQFAWQVRYPGKDNKLGTYNYKLIDAVNEFGVDFKNSKASLDDFVPREIHIPKGLPVLFKIRARDVLHSVFAPHFRLKMDAVPGMPTKFWFIPRLSTQDMRDKLGNQNFNYELACTEVCGRGHFAMKFIIVVDEPEDYKKWYASQETWLSQNPDYLKSLTLLSSDNSQQLANK